MGDSITTEMNVSYVNSNLLDVVTLLHTVTAALQDGISRRLRRRSSATACGEGGDFDRLAVLKHRVGIEVGVDAEDLVYSYAVGSSNASNEVSSNNLIETTRRPRAVRIAAGRGPRGKFQVFVGLEDATSLDILVELIEGVAENVQRSSNGLNGVTLLDDVDLAVAFAVIRLDVGAAGQVSTRQANLLAHLEQVDALAAGKDGRNEIICIRGNIKVVSDMLHTFD